MLDYFCQVMVVFTGVTAVYLVGLKDKRKRWGYVFGLLSAPFWYYTLIYHSQWIIVIVHTCYTVSWYNGFKNYWLKNKLI